VWNGKRKKGKTGNLSYIKNTGGKIIKETKNFYSNHSNFVGEGCGRNIGGETVKPSIPRG